MMRFFLDHDVPVEVARVLVQEGHGVVQLREVLRRTALDAAVLEYCNNAGLILVTCNRDDFLTLVKTRPNPGLVVLIRRRTRQMECGHLLALLRRAGECGLRGNINFA